MGGTPTPSQSQYMPFHPYWRSCDISGHRQFSSSLRVRKKFRREEGSAAAFLTHPAAIRAYDCVRHVVRHCRPRRLPNPRQRNYDTRCLAPRVRTHVNAEDRMDMDIVDAPEMKAA